MAISVTEDRSDEDALVQQEIAFAKVLAGNDKTLRDRALKKLKRWLTARGTGKCVLTDDDFRRIWTGLFYCMWMSDKPLIQEELAESLSSLVHCFVNKKLALLFIKSFHSTMILEWQGLDQHRLDKFCMLVRRFLRQCLQYCKKHGWNKKLCRGLGDIISGTVYHNNTSLGYALQFTEVYLEELAKVGDGELNSYKVILMLEPFARALSSTQDARVRSQIGRQFRHLMNQTDVGMQYQERFQAWKNEGFPGRSADDMVLVDNEEEDEDDGGGEDEANIRVLDPRAGAVSVNLPQLPIDAAAFVVMFSRHLTGQHATLKGKKMLSTLVQQFQSLKQGKYPLAIEKEIIPLKPKKLAKKSAINLLKFDEQLKKKSRVQQKKIKKRKIEDGEEEEEEDSKMNGVVKKKNIKNVASPDKKQKVVAETPVAKKHKTDETPVKKPKRVSDESDDKMNGSFVVEACEDSPAEKQTVKRRVSAGWQVDEAPEDDTLAVSPIKETEAQVEDPWDKPLEEGEVEIVIPSKKYMAKRKSDGEVPAFWTKAMKKASGTRKSTGSEGVVKNPYSEGNEEEPVSTPGRRLSFALNRNMFQEATQYLEDVKNSPSIPFDASLKPKQSALKPGLSPSPINPFYKKLRPRRF